MKLLACLLLAIGIVVGLAAHQPTAMAMAFEATTSTVTVADPATAEEANKPVSEADIVDAGHCFTPAIVTDVQDVAAVLRLAMAWVPSNDGVEGREPARIGRPPDLT